MGTLRDLQFALQLKIEELRQRDTLIDELELELDTKDELIRRLQEELDRYRATVSLPACSAQGEDSPPANRETVISESVRLELSAAYSKTWDKSQESQRLIQDAFLKNELLRNLDEGEVRDVIGCMYPYAVHQGCCVVQEGSSGAQAGYVVEEGRLHVTKDGLKVLTLDVGDLFGEAALLYPCTHAFSVSAQDDCKLWVIDRRSYQSALMQSGLSSLSRSLKLLRSVPCLQSLPEDVIIKMSDLMEEIHYSEGDYIIRQGASGDTFYIISNGQVNVTEKRTGLEEQLVQRLSERQWFGEKALWGEDVRTVSVIAAGGVTCLVIDRETFKDILGGLVFDSGHEAPQNMVPKDESEKDAALLPSSTLSDFQIICSLGVGKFGHVDLVQLRSDVKCLFAMRVLTKKLILQSGQQEHILRERSILMEAHCPFIVRLHKTFRDAECLYMLMEAGLCGDLYTLLKDKGSLDEGGAKFYTACVAEALTFLHSRNLVYRDVKPENVVLDERGYAKLTGSRCAKRVEAGKKTYTFCGTPAYVAPEIILCKGHGSSADLWSLGVFLFELLSGGLPFSGNDTVGTMSAAVRGIDQIDFPKTISKSACSLIKKLCRRNPAERLGSQRNGAKDIQKHKWFEGFNWDGLCRGTLKPALIPKVTHDVASGSCGYYSGDAAELCATWEDF